MKLTRKYMLERPARKAGGDRYIEQLDPGVTPMMETAYINQSVARADGTSKQMLWLTISDEPPED